MADRPILFSGPMVRAILDGSKTETRRLVTKSTSERGSGQWEWLDFEHADVFPDGPSMFANSGYLHVPAPHEPGINPDPGEDWETRHRVYPRIQPGDRLWVRETWAPEPCNCCWSYRATDPDAQVGRWKPSIFMPRWACRLHLRVLSVHAERLHDITDAGAQAEGVTPKPGETLREAWVRLWDSINSKRAPWADNPWVWVIRFAREVPDANG